MTVYVASASRKQLQGSDFTATCAIGRSGVIALSDFPHARNNCAAYKWSEAPEKHCPQCFCYVCDEPASKCKQWAAHCVATAAPEC